jgi:hypothetical protein
VAIASSSQPLAAHLADSWNGIGAMMMWMRRHGFDLSLNQRGERLQEDSQFRE